MGVAALEYAALLGIAASIIAVAFAGVPYTAVDRVRPVICKIFGDSCPPPPKKPEVVLCTTNEVTTEHNKNFQVLFYSRKEKDRTVVAQRSNGEIWETTGKDTLNGFNIEAGFGFTVKGKGASLTAGGGVDWGAHESTTWKFKNQQQRDAFYSAVKAEMERIAGSTDNVFELMEKKDELKQVPYTIAERMGVQYSTYYGSSSTGHAQVGGSFSIVSGGADGEWGDQIGTQRNSDGTVVKSYRSNNTYGINGSVGVIVAEGAARGDSGDGSIISIVYDKNGNPQKAIITSETSATWNADVSFGKTWTPDRKKKGPPDEDGNPTDDGGPQGDKGAGGKWTPWADGGGEKSVSQIHIPLAGDKHAQEVVAGLVDPGKAFTGGYPGGMQQLTNDFDELVTTRGTIYNMRYDRDYSKDGVEFSASFIVKLGGYENTTEITEMTLREAWIVDPTTGERRPWRECMR